MDIFGTGIKATFSFVGTATILAFAIKGHNLQAMRQLPGIVRDTVVAATKNKPEMTWFITRGGNKFFNGIESHDRPNNPHVAMTSAPPQITANPTGTAPVSPHAPVSSGHHPGEAQFSMAA